MTVVHKFNIAQDDRLYGIPMRGGAKVLYAEPFLNHARGMTIWLEYNPDNIPGFSMYTLYKILDTGTDIPERSKHQITIRQQTYIWHLYKIQQYRTDAPIVFWNTDRMRWEDEKPRWEDSIGRR